MANQIVKLKKGSDYLYPYADFMGIDTTNVIATGSILNNTYTATQDCYVVFQGNGSIQSGGSNGAKVVLHIDNVLVQQMLVPHLSLCLLLKKGQAIKGTGNYGNATYNVFGIKY